MSGKFSFTYRLGDRGRTAAEATNAAPGPAPHGDSAAGAVPQVLPQLESYDLFPTRIWQARLEPLVPHLPRWVQDVLEMRAAAPKPAGRTNRQGWNSEDMSVLERPALAALRGAIRAACASALDEMGQGEREFELQSWVNLHDRGGFNFLHVHEGSLLSGGFYLQVPAGSGQFVIRDPRPGVILGYVKGGVPNGHADVHLTPSAGLLVLFPCWMEHYVEPHEGDEPRIMIAFNANAPEGTAKR
jgi:uncharacterized protein (TIGR02466 family)